MTVVTDHFYNQSIFQQYSSNVDVLMCVPVSGTSATDKKPCFDFRFVDTSSVLMSLKTPFVKPLSVSRSPVCLKLGVFLFTAASLWRRRGEGGRHWGSQGHGGYLWVVSWSHLHGQQDVFGDCVASVLSNDEATNWWGTMFCLVRIVEHFMSVVLLFEEFELRLSVIMPLFFYREIFF